MEESDIDMLSTSALAKFQKEDKIKFSAEYRAANSLDSVQDEEQYWISEDGELDCNLSSFMGLGSSRYVSFYNPKARIQTIQANAQKGGSKGGHCRTPSAF